MMIMRFLLFLLLDVYPSTVSTKPAGSSLIKPGDEHMLDGEGKAWYYSTYPLNTRAVPAIEEK
jgi:hypothetical protein